MYRQIPCRYRQVSARYLEVPSDRLPYRHLQIGGTVRYLIGTSKVPADTGHLRELPDRGIARYLQMGVPSGTFNIRYLTGIVRYLQGIVR